LNIAGSLAGGKDEASLITLLEEYFKAIYPFEHNSIPKQMEIVASYAMHQSRAALLYAKYCNYCDIKDHEEDEKDDKDEVDDEGEFEGGLLSDFLKDFEPLVAR
jgi:hypothetical protein